MGLYKIEGGQVTSTIKQLDNATLNLYSWEALAQD
jgi:hypothetical protein